MTAETTNQADQAPHEHQGVLTITPDALAKVLEIRAGEDDPTGLALRIEVVGVTGVEYAYELSFEPVAEKAPTDISETHGDLTVLIPADSVEKLSGATLDLPKNQVQEGLVLRNPNRPNPFGSESIELTGDVAERIRALLDRQVNPAIAAHGGVAELVAVEEDVAYVRMAGGCQGCGMAAATLRHGIEAAIVDAVPEITRVVDTTDHAAGTNPYYEPAH